MKVLERLKLYSSLISKNSIVKNVYFDRISVSEKRLWQVGVKLNLQFKNLSQNIYDKIDGCGTSSSLPIALEIALSESFERWAFDRFSNQFQTTFGMAAYLKGNDDRVRNQAIRDAQERELIHAFWKGELCKYDFEVQENTLILKYPNQLFYVVITYSIQKNGTVVYGFGAGDSKSSALSHAEIERSRNKFLNERISSISDSLSLDLFEKRMIHYSTQEGLHEYLQHISVQGQREVRTFTIPRIVYDAELIGDWSKFCSVWCYKTDKVLFCESDDSLNLPIF